MHIWTRQECDSTPKTSTSSNQTKFQNWDRKEETRSWLNKESVVSVETQRKLGVLQWRVTRLVSHTPGQASGPEIVGQSKMDSFLWALCFILLFFVLLFFFWFDFWVLLFCFLEKEKAWTWVVTEMREGLKGVRGRAHVQNILHEQTF